MRYFIVKVTSKATPDNKNFAGEVHVNYFGKDQKMIGSYVSKDGGELIAEDPLNEWRIEEYGYTRLCDARHSWIYKNGNTLNALPDGTSYWEDSVEIVEVG